MDINENVKDYLEKTTIPLRLACLNEDGWPVVLSLWYLFDDGIIYCATQQRAQVVEYIKKEPRCSFEIAADDPPYCGIRGRALATIDPTSGSEILQRLLNRYVGGTNNPLAKQLLRRSETEVAIYLEPQWMTSWNYSRRMEELISGKVSKICPE